MCAYYFIDFTLFKHFIINMQIGIQGVMKQSYYFLCCNSPLLCNVLCGDRWFLVPRSYRGWAWSRRGRSPRSSGPSWTLSRNWLSSEPDMKETSCWSSEVCTLKVCFLNTATSILPCVRMQHILGGKGSVFIWSCVFHVQYSSKQTLVCPPNPSREELGCCSADCRMFACAFAGRVPLSMAHGLEAWKQVNLLY